MDTNGPQPPVEPGSARKKNTAVDAIAYGIAFGMMVGVLLGVITENLGLWLPMGAGVGILLGGVVGANRNKTTAEDGGNPDSNS